MFVFIDTAVKGCNIALADSNGIINLVQEPIEKGHAERIIPLFEDALATSARSVDAIEAVYVTVGPGSFTGLRVGLTTARFIGFSLDVPVLGITSFQAFSCGVLGDEERLVLVETKRRDFYVQKMDHHHRPIGAAQSLETVDILLLLASGPDCVVTGDAIERFLQECKDMPYKTIPQMMIDLQAVTRAIAQGNIETIKPDAFYIRDADVSAPKKKA